MSAQSSPTQTSTEIFHERNALQARVEELEAAIRTVKRETEYALQLPVVSVLTLCRIRTVARLSLDEHDHS